MSVSRDAFDVVREWYRALDRGDLQAVVGAYHPDCVVEHVDGADRVVTVGVTDTAAYWAAELAAYRGALPGGGRVDVRLIGGLEAGWGWVRATWLRGRQPVAGGDPRYASGYSHFWVEDGRIRRQRGVSQPLDAVQALASPATPVVDAETRRYPKRPIVGVGAVVLAEDDRVVLVRRRHEPLAGQWSLPGGTFELGETLEAGVAREIREETSLVVDVGPVVEVFDRILLDEHAAVQYHFVLIDYLCRARHGTLQAGSDVADVLLADPDALDAYGLTEKARGVIARARHLIERA